jgi:hypothetical protein
MAGLADVIAGYHRLLADAKYRDLAWAENLQERMRSRGLTESGRLLTPVLRPHFISKEQLTCVASASGRLSNLLGRVETLAVNSPQLLNRMRMLPAEKMLAVLPCGYARPGMASRFNAVIHNGSVSLRSFETCAGVGLAYADLLADMFLSLPIMRELIRSGYKVAKLGHMDRLLGSILEAWKDFGGIRKPNLAVLEWKSNATHASEADFIAELFCKSGLVARAVGPEQLEYAGNKLRVGEFVIDVVFRRIDIQDLLVRCELSHPLLKAYRQGAICLVNGFRSEIWRRRSSLELLTGSSVSGTFSTADADLIRQFVPWTRFVTARKTSYRNKEIDLIPFLAQHRDQFVLRPNEISADGRVFTGAELTQSMWDGALRAALQTPYVVQERCVTACEEFPVFRYGTLEFRELSVSVLPHVFNGVLQGASAVLETCPVSSAQVIALAPVLTVQ